MRRKFTLWHLLYQMDLQLPREGKPPSQRKKHRKGGPSSLEFELESLFLSPPSFLLSPGESSLREYDNILTLITSILSFSSAFFKIWFPGGRDHRPRSNIMSSSEELSDRISVCIEPIKCPWHWIKPWLVRKSALHTASVVPLAPSCKKTYWPMRM